MAIHAPFGFFAPAAVGTEYLLDEYGTNIVSAFGMRKLKEDYTGNICKVRRSSDNSEQAIGLSGDNFDTASLETFLGNSDGFVSEWYDQSSNAFTASMGTTTQQPQIAISGSTITQGGNASMFFDGANDVLNNHSAAEFVSSSNHPLAFFTNVQFNDAQDYSNLLRGRFATADHPILSCTIYPESEGADAYKQNFFQRSNGSAQSDQDISTNPIDFKPQVLAWDYDGSNIDFYNDNGTANGTEANSLGSQRDLDRMYIGGDGKEGDFYSYCYLNEWYLYSVEKDASDVAAITNNITSSYYQGDGSLTTTGLVGGWDASEYTSGDVVDIATGSRTYAIVGSPTIVSSSAGYIEFDGSSDYLSGSTGDTKTDTIWVTDVEGQDYAFEVLYNSDELDASYRAFGTYWGTNSGTNEVYWFGESGTGGGNGHYHIAWKDNDGSDLRFHSTNGTQMAQPGTWYHVVFNVRTNVGGAAYVQIFQNNIMQYNKVESTAIDSLKTPGSPAGFVTFGAQGSASSKFNGKIAAIRMYDKALSKEEVNNNYLYFRNTRGYDI